MIDFKNLPKEFSNSPGFLFFQLGKVLKRAIEEELKHFELHLHEYELLKVVSVYGALSQHAFGEHFGIDKASVTEIVEGLEKRDLIYRNKSSKDGRVKLLNLSQKGHAVCGRATRRINRLYKEFLEPLDDSDWQVTRKTVLRLLESCQSS